MPEKAENRIDRYKQIALGDREPNKLEEKHWEKINAAFTMSVNGDSRNKVVKQLSKLYSISHRQGWNIIRDAFMIYGQVMDLDKKGMRNILYERQLIVAKEAIRNKDYKTASLAYDKAAKLMGLHDQEIVLQDPEKFLEPQSVVFTSDIEVLKKEQGLEVEEADFEEINK